MVTPLAARGAAALSVAAALLSATTACTTIGKPSTGFAEPFPANYRAIVVEGIKEYFFDPYSVRDAEISEPRVAPPFDLGGREGWAVCLRANAKNRMGAYVGRRESVMMIAGDRVIAYTEGPAPYYCNDASFSPFPELEALHKLPGT